MRAKTVDPQDNIEPIDFEQPNVVNSDVVPVEEYIVENNTDKNVIVQDAAAQFVDKIKNGISPGKAAASIGTTLGAIATNDEMRNAISQLVSVGEIPAEARKRMLRAGLNKLFMESVGATDIKSRKIALEAAKLIGQDPEVNANAGDGATVVFELGDLADVFQKPINLPGIERKD